MRVLIANSDSLSSARVMRMVDHLGGYAIAAYDARAALAALGTTPSVDILIIDLGLDQGRGLELLQWVRPRYDQGTLRILTTGTTVDAGISELTAALGSEGHFVSHRDEGRLHETLGRLALSRMTTERTEGRVAKSPSAGHTKVGFFASARDPRDDESTRFFLVQRAVRANRESYS